LITQSELDNTKVLNSNSVRGVDLAKLIANTNNQYTSIETTDVVLLFEFLKHDDTNNMSYTDEKDKVNTYSSYKVHIIIYGNTSDYVAHKLKSRLLTSKVIQDLYDKGIYLKEVSPIETDNEFINNTYWNRTDLDIFLGCRYEFSQISVEPSTSESDTFEIDINTI